MKKKIKHLLKHAHSETNWGNCEFNKVIDSDTFNKLDGLISYKGTFSLEYLHVINTDWSQGDNLEIARRSAGR